MTISEMRRLLDEHQLQLTKSLGQNFLHDQNLLRKIVAAAELQKSDKVLEIGPGLGPLTELLLAEVGEVLAIEKDARLVKILQERFRIGPPQMLSSAIPVIASASQEKSNLHLLHEDALEFLQREQGDWTGWKLVSNLPYSVASPILVELARNERGPLRMVATLQIEVARRLMAGPGDADYGLLTLLVQLDYQPLTSFKIPASCFFPEPDVDSACVSLVKRSQPLLRPADRDAYFSLVKQAFSQRRKMMLKLLKTRWPAPLLEKAFETAAIPPASRAESVSLEQFVRLARCLAADSRMAEEMFDVVDAQDRVIDRRTRSEVHRLGLMHRAVHVLVFNSRGEVFLQKRSRFKDRQPGVWDSSASGHVDSGEDYGACAVRELREELGVDCATALEPLFKLAASPETDQEHVWVYRCRAEGPFTLAPEEIETGGWFAPQAVNNWMAERPQEFATALLFLWPRLDCHGTDQKH